MKKKKCDSCKQPVSLPKIRFCSRVCADYSTRGYANEHVTEFIARKVADNSSILKNWEKEHIERLLK